MEIRKDRGIHDVLATDCQIVLIDILSRALSENGIASKEQRQRICERFCEAFGDFMDQGWFKSEDSGDKCIYPLLCFAERGVWSDMEAGEIVSMTIPDPTSFLYESYSENCQWYFEEHDESLGNIETGSC